VPAFGALSTRSDGCEFVDVKCGGVMLAWQWLRSVECRIAHHYVVDKFCHRRGTKSSVDSDYKPWSGWPHQHLRSPRVEDRELHPPSS
jgi:hypothetical protein